MKRLLVRAFVLPVLLLGCRQQPPTPAIHTYEVFKRRYFLAIETMGSYHALLPPAVHEKALALQRGAGNFRE
jgi:hypothetical protein